jgi:hypothetical protein
MASAAEKFDVGDLVYFEGKLCFVNSVDRSQLGFHTYVLTDTNNGSEYRAHKHKLEHFIVDNDVDVLEVDWDVPLIDEVDQIEKEHVNAEPTSTRHIVMSDNDIDEVAKQRLSINTEHQTRWAVNLLKGLLYIYIICYM